MAKIHDLFIVELAEVIKGYGNDPDVEDPFRVSEFYRFYELPNIAVSRENFEKMRPLWPERNYDVTWDALGKVYNMQGVPDEAKSIIGDVMLNLGEPERETGEWLPDNTNYIEERYICSNCKRSHRVETCMGKPMWDFCPSCGKRMSGGES